MYKNLVGAGPSADARTKFSVFKTMKRFRDDETTFAETPDEVIRLVLSGEFDFVYTELDYEVGDRGGFRVLEAIQDVDCVKVLWTNLNGCADLSLEEIKAKANALGANIWDSRIPFTI